MILAVDSFYCFVFASKALQAYLFLKQVAHGYVGDCDHGYGVQYRKNHPQS